MQLTERHTFKTDKKQKRTLIILHKKYKINTSAFIRDAIKEKLERDKDDIFKNFFEVQDYTKNKCPF